MDRCVDCRVYKFKVHFKYFIQNTLIQEGYRKENLKRIGIRKSYWALQTLIIE